MSLRNVPQILIYNARVVTETTVEKKSWLVISEGRIRSWGNGARLPAVDSSALRLNAQENYLVPGFIDLHIHGDPDCIARQQVRCGTTGFLLSLHTAGVHRLIEQISRVSRENQSGAKRLGFHIEGPFISKDMAGAQPIGSIRSPDSRSLRKLIKAAGNDIKIMTLAAEFTGSKRLIALLKKNNIAAALGHTNAGIEQARRAVDAGAEYTTHVFNRMSGIGARNPGVITQVLLDERVKAEVIADGRHVHPALLKLLVKNKSADSIVLVTDSVAAMDTSALKVIAGVYRMENHTIAGSRLTMMQAVKNMVYFTGVSLPESVKMASLNPAKVIAMDNRKGRIESGYDADLVLFDKNFKCRTTIVGGRIVFKC